MRAANSAIVFDPYGTLFDVSSVVAAAERLFPGYGDALSARWRQKQLEYTWLRSLMGAYEDFWEVTAAALRHAARTLGLPLSGDSMAALMDEYLHLRPYPDVLPALRTLQSHRRAILSNGTPHMLQSAVAGAGLGSEFERVLSVDPLRTYKPDPRVYQMAVEELGVARQAVVFVSANPFDIAGAGGFGFVTVWINRMGATFDELGREPDYTLAGLDGLPGVLAGFSPETSDS